MFTRSGGVWTQQGNKLVGSGAVGAAQQGISVALSADGNTAIVGGHLDNSSAGAAWVFTRSGGVWTQQGNKLVGSGAVGAAQQGISVALSPDSNTAIVGGHLDNSSAGAAWVFTRSGGVWTQQGNKLVGTGAVGGAAQGYSVALSCNAAIVGGRSDNRNFGAAWAFVAPTPATATHDFNADCLSDILWRETGGSLAAWMLNGFQVLATGGYGVVLNNWTVVGQRDFNGDGFADILWRDANTGSVGLWLLNGLSVAQTGGFGAPDSSWVIAGTGDFNGDGKGDILWRHTPTGMVGMWLMNGLSAPQTGVVGTLSSNWQIVGTGDFNGDGNWDILWYHNPTAPSESG